MSPPPSAAPLGRPSSPLWMVAVLFAVFALLLVAGLVTGVIRATPSKARRSAGRAAVAFDATFAPQGRREALEYLLHDQHRVVLEKERGDGGGDGDQPPVVFRYPDEDDGEPRAVD